MKINGSLSELRDWMMVVTMVIVSLYIAPTWSTCYHPEQIKNGKFDIMPRSTATGANSGLFLNGSIAKISCHQGYRHSPPNVQSLLCFDGRWVNANDVHAAYTFPLCGKLCVPITPLYLHNGFYFPAEHSDEKEIFRSLCMYLTFPCIF